MDRHAAIQATADHFAGRPFAWGQADCATLVTDYLRRIRYPIPVAAPRRRTALGAQRALAGLGVSSMADLLDRHLAACAPLAACTGDLAGVPSGRDGDPACGIVSGADVLVIEESGLTARSLADATHAWRV